VFRRTTLLRYYGHVFLHEPPAEHNILFPHNRLQRERRRGFALGLFYKTFPNYVRNRKFLYEFVGDDRIRRFVCVGFYNVGHRPLFTIRVILRRGWLESQPPCRGYYQIRYISNSSLQTERWLVARAAFIRNHKIQNNVGCGDAYRRVSISLTWDGSYSSVSVQWDTSSGFITNDNSMNDLSITNAVITGLTANTNIILEYCRILQRASLAVQQYV
jgi:hypothetical protein